MVKLLQGVGGRLGEEAPVVVMARGHSGTRVLSRALEALGIAMGTTATSVTSDTQDRGFTQHIKYLARGTLHLPPAAAPSGWRLFLFRARAAGYVKRLELPAAGWGWKFPETYLIPNYVAAVFPKARHLHMIRDGRDVAFKEHLTDDPRRRLGKTLLAHLGALDKPHHVQAALSWEFQIRRYQEFLDATGTAAHVVRFERLCAEPVATMRAVCQFLGHPMNRACEDFLVQSIKPELIGQYRGQDAREVAEVEAAIGGTLAAWGYG